jgi:hypothetical protein
MSTLTGYAVAITGLGADHTYVKSDNPPYSWPCWGRDTGGKAICSGKGDATLANCISQSNSHAGIIYSITGVCHQTANRILYPAQVLVSKANGYGVSHLTYGTYGLEPPMVETFDERLEDCHKKCNISHSKPLENRKMNGSSSTEDPEQAYLRKVMEIYAEALNKSTDKDKNAPIAETELISIQERDFRLMMELRFGNAMEPNLTNQVLKQKFDLLKQKNKIDRNFLGDDISVERYAQEGNELITETLRQIAETIGNEQFKTLFGISPPKGTFVLIDPAIVAKTYKEGVYESLR